MDEKYILQCPRCGRGEGYAPTDTFYADGDPESADELIEDESVMTRRGPARRVRCPRCGSWVSPDRVRPSD